MERILGGEHEVTTCCLPQEALELVRGGARYDVILSDVMMPRMTGIELHDAIAAIDPAQAARTIFVTASVLGGTLEETLRKLGRTVVRKPIGVKAMRDLVRERLT